MNEAQQQLRAKHGTPDEFAAACNAAADDLFVTTAECDAAIQKYRDEWNAAGSVDAEKVETQAGAEERRNALEAVEFGQGLLMDWRDYVHPTVRQRWPELSPDEKAVAYVTANALQESEVRR